MKGGDHTTLTVMLERHPDEKTTKYKLKIRINLDPSVRSVYAEGNLCVVSINKERKTFNHKFTITNSKCVQYSIPKNIGNNGRLRATIDIQPWDIKLKKKRSRGPLSSEESSSDDI